MFFVQLREGFVAVREVEKRRSSWGLQHVRPRVAHAVGEFEKCDVACPVLTSSCSLLKGVCHLGHHRRHWLHHCALDRCGKQRTFSFLFALSDAVLSLQTTRLCIAWPL